MLKADKYYIEWDEEEIRYFLPKSKFSETIKLKEIISIEIGSHEIKMQFPDNDKRINLRNISYNERKRIKEKFEEIKKRN